MGGVVTIPAFPPKGPRVSYVYVQCVAYIVEKYAIFYIIVHITLLHMCNMLLSIVCTHPCFNVGRATNDAVELFIICL